jgi:chemotaxis protein MotB
MGKRDEKPAAPEDEGEGVPLWYISFADMATLLLAFFVMLTTFASFDNNSVKKINGVFASMSSYSIFPEGPSKDSMMRASPKANISENGAEKPTDIEQDQTKNPPVMPFVADSDAFKGRKVLYIPCRRLFWGPGTSLRQPEARQCLTTVAEFLRQMPCHVIVSEIGPGSGNDDARLKRASAVLDVLVGSGNLSASMCGLSGSQCSLSTRTLDQPMIQVVLLSRDLCK